MKKPLLGLPQDTTPLPKFVNLMYKTARSKLTQNMQEKDIIQTGIEK